MEASWSEVAKADGYRVTIYEEKDGNFTDSGKTYSYDAEDIKASEIKGVSYDADTDTFTLDMALTVKGDTIDENQKVSGNTQTSELEAGKNYKIGVQAYNYLTDETGEKMANAQVYSCLLYTSIAWRYLDKYSGCVKISTDYVHTRERGTIC